MIYIDHRERKYNDPNLAIPKLLENIGLDFVKRQLHVGDYIIVGENLTACIEFKNAMDYVGSILDGRLNDELLSMSSNYDYNVLLIQGSATEGLIDSELPRERWFNFLAGCVTNISPVGNGSRISVISVETPHDAAGFIHTLSKKIHSGHIFREPSAQKVKIPTGKEQLYSIMWMFPPSCHIGKKRAEHLLAKFGNIHNLCNACEEELVDIDGIGPIIAKRMTDHVVGN